MSTNQAEREVLALASITESPSGQGVAAKIRNGIAGFDRDERGNVTIMFTLLSSIMIGFTGLAVDFGRWVNARDQTVAAMDAAVMAGGRAMQTNGGDGVKAKAVALAYYKAGIKNRIPTFNDNVSFEVSATSKGQVIEAVGNAYIKAPFIATSYSMILGQQGQATSPAFDLWPLLAAGNPSTDTSRALFATGAGGNKNLEMAIMLDVSGSMSGQKMTDMKLAAKDLIDIVMWADQSKYWSKVALVPFSADVRLTQSMRNAVAKPNIYDKYSDGSSGTVYDAYKSLCVVERGGNDRYTDAAPAAGKYITVGYDKNGSIQNGGNCSQQPGSEVVPLATDKQMLKDKITNLPLGGGTAGHIGTAWTYYMLSSKWQSIVGNASGAAAYSDSTVKKIAVLMTDGEYNYVYRPIKECKKSNGNAVKCSDNSVATVNVPEAVGIDDSNDPSDSINGISSAEQAKQICTKMKNDNIEVYTVGFALGSNQTAINTLAFCATDAAHAYTPATGEELRQAFRDIAVKTTKLVLTQ